MHMPHSQILAHLLIWWWVQECRGIPASRIQHATGCQEYRPHPLEKMTAVFISSWWHPPRPRKRTPSTSRVSKYPHFDVLLRHIRHKCTSWKLRLGSIVPVGPAHIRWANSTTSGVAHASLVWTIQFIFRERKKETTHQIVGNYQSSLTIILKSSQITCTDADTGYVFAK